MTCQADANHPVEYLRVSITDRCNLRCVYCMPPEGVAWCPHADILRYEEIVAIVRVAVQLGVRKVRLTGGEPLVRPGAVELVRMLADIPGLDDLAMTTNGTLLARHARELKDAGLRRVNVSLDTLRADRFRQITRRGHLEDVLAGIEAAQAAGLTPVKINAVIVRGLNDDEVVTLARKTVDEGWHMRFIELMPVGNGAVTVGDWRKRLVTATEMRERIEAELGPLQPARMRVGGGPARYYRLPGAKGTVGFITPISERFCAHCNRMRLTADGKLRPCLLSDYEIDLRSPLRNGADEKRIAELLCQGIALKPRRHHLDERHHPEKRNMSEIGG